MIPIIGKLHREQDVNVLLHSRSLVNKSVVSILKTHRFARQIAGEELSVTETMPFLRALTTLDLGPSQIDIGMLAATYRPTAAGSPSRSSPRRPSPGRRARTRSSAVRRATWCSTASAASAGSSPACSSRRPARATAAPAGDRRPQGQGPGHRQARLAAAARLDPRPVPGHDHRRRGERQDHRQRQRDPGHLLGRPDDGRLHGVRHRRRHPDRQHRPVARPRGAVEAPPAGRLQGRAHRAGQERRP